MSPKAARQQQKRLLEEEIKLVQRQLESQRKQVQTGVIPSEATLSTEREILELKRKVAALDAGLPISFAASEAAPAVSSEAEEVRRIQALIKDSPDLINAPDATTGETLLQSAAAKGKLAVVKVLLDNGAAVDGLQQPGLTPLHYAAGNGHKAVVDMLLSKGAKPDAHTEAGVTPLDLAAQKGYEEVAKALLAAGAPVNTQTKSKTSFGSSTSSLKYVIGAGQTPLHLAAAAGYPGMVELLLAKGADPNVEDAEGRTPLSYAAQKPAIIQLLLAAHADPNAGRVDLPLAIAAYYGDLPALRLLLAAGADPNTNAMVNFSVETRSALHSRGGRFSPLLLATSQRKTDAVAELLRFKADPDGLGPGGKPILYDALLNIPTLKVLLDGGANPNQTVGGTPLLLQAVGDRNQPAAEMLLDHHADVNATNNRSG